MADILVGILVVWCVLLTAGLWYVRHERAAEPDPEDTRKLVQRVIAQRLAARFGADGSSPYDLSAHPNRERIRERLRQRAAARE